ncbi:restriction endonuclease subunit S [Pantoea agglomerans]|uniref:restriction endonuclease subunit S n=1 Tax=Enterobacter agglomerans TaxID=549 RepID=UPI00320AB4F9
MSELSYMDKLMESAGAERLPLGDLGELVRGNGLPKSDFTESGIPAIHYGQIYTFYGLSTETTKSFVSQQTAKKLKKVNPGDVIITNTSENVADVGKALVYLGKEDAVTGGHATIFKPKNGIIGKYFAYYTQTEFFASEKRKYSKGTKVIDVSATDMAKITIPIPCPDNLQKSLAIQSEIVQILDKFSALTSELTAELIARKKQYNYYCDQLLNFGENIPTLTLSDCCGSISDGDHQAPPKTDSGIPFITISNLTRSNTIDFENTYFVADDYYQRIHDKRKAREKDILYTVVGSIGIPIYIDFNMKFAFQRHMAILRPDEEKIISKYLYHVMRSSFFLKKANSVAVGAAQKTITLSALNKMDVPVPPIGQQERIVNILDKFDTLANSLDDGLPHEIKLRQKQYEYYRDMLFSFPKSKVAEA